MIDIFTKYAQVKALKDKKGKNAFIEIVNKSDRKPNKLRLIKDESFTINL